MSFTDTELLVTVAKALQGGVMDGDARMQWFESATPFEFNLDASMIWTQGTLIRANPAPDLATALTLAAGTLSGILESSSFADGVQLTPVPGVNNTWVALGVYGDFTTWRKGWVPPPFAPQANGVPSLGYSVRMYEGHPSLGNEILTTDGTTGTGVNKRVGWIFNYALGMLMVADDFTMITNPFMRGFQYIGTTAGSGGGIANLDGGRADENFGGVVISPIDGGDSTS